MSDPFLGEVKLVSFHFAPKGWAQCNGQLLPINQNQALFALLGTMYGGDGRTTFALPDLQGRAALHIDRGLTQGQAGGETAHTLSAAEMPVHTHFVKVSSSASGGTTTGANNFLGGGNNVYHVAPGDTTLNPLTVTNTGGSQAHANMQPYTVVLFIIALQGIFPSRN